MSTIVKAVCQHCQRVTVVPAEAISAATAPHVVGSDRVITDGFPEGWHVQDRASGEALLCAPHYAFGGKCVCIRPKILSTDEWLETARSIANGLASPQTAPRDSAGPFFIRVADFFDTDATAASFMNEDGDGGFIGAMYRMAREIERLRAASAEVEG